MKRLFMPIIVCTGISSVFTPAVIWAIQRPQPTQTEALNTALAFGEYLFYAMVALVCLAYIISWNAVLIGMRRR